MTDDDNALRSVVVSDLLPASRYRARVRCPVVDEESEEVEWPSWDLSPISDWYMTLPDLPEKTEVLHATTFEKRCMVVQWKLPRINGSLITHFHLQRMRVRPGDEGDSDTSSEGSGDDGDDEAGPKRGEVGEEDDDEDAMLATLRQSAARIAAHKAAMLVAKERPVYDQWITVVDECNVLEATDTAKMIASREDLALSKMQGITPESVFDEKLAALLRRDGFAATIRLLRIASVLRSNEPLTPYTMLTQAAEPDVAWLVKDIPPGSHHIYRVAVKTDKGWGALSNPSATTRSDGVCVCLCVVRLFPL